MRIGYSPEFVHIWVQTIHPLHTCALALNSYEANGGHAEPLNVGEPNKNIIQIKIICLKPEYQKTKYQTITILYIYTK